MARGGPRIGAGRPKKAAGKMPAGATPPADQAPGESVVRTPLDYMLAVMNDSSAESERRDRMAVAAAPFCHRKMGERGKKEERGEAAKKVTGKFTPAAPPKLVAVKP